VVTSGLLLVQITALFVAFSGKTVGMSVSASPISSESVVL